MITQRFPFLRTKRGVALVVAMLLLIIGGGLAGLAALHHGAAAASDAITSDTYFYGQSPPVYPSRECLALLLLLLPSSGAGRRCVCMLPVRTKLTAVADMTGAGTWADSYTKAVAMVKQMTLAEKVGFL